MKMYGLCHPPLILSQKVPTYALLTFHDTTYVKNMHLHRDILLNVKSCYNPLRLGTIIVLVSSGIDFVNTPRLYSDRDTR